MTDTLRGSRPATLTVDEVDRLMRAVEKIERLAEPEEPETPRRRRKRVERVVEPRPEPNLADLAASIERRLLLLDAMTVENVTEALLNARLGVEGADEHEQWANTMYRARIFIVKLQQRLAGLTPSPDPSNLNPVEAPDES